MSTWRTRSCCSGGRSANWPKLSTSRSLPSGSTLSGLMRQPLANSVADGVPRKIDEWTKSRSIASTVRRRHTSCIVWAPRLSPNSTNRGRRSGIHPPQVAGDRVHEVAVLLDREPGARQRHRRRQHRVLHRRDRAVAEGHVLQRLGQHVVDVARARRRGEAQHLAVEGARAHELVHDEVDAVLDLGRGVEADEDADGVGNGRLPHDLVDLLSGEDHVDEPAALARERVERHDALRSARHHRRLGGDVVGRLHSGAALLHPAHGVLVSGVHPATEHGQRDRVPDRVRDDVVVGGHPGDGEGHATRDEPLADLEADDARPDADRDARGLGKRDVLDGRVACLGSLLVGRWMCHADTAVPAGRARGIRVIQRRLALRSTPRSPVPMTAERPAPIAATRAVRLAATRSRPRRMRSSSRGGRARDRPSATAPMTMLLPTVKASRAEADAASVRPPVIRRADGLDAALGDGDGGQGCGGDDAGGDRLVDGPPRLQPRLERRSDRRGGREQRHALGEAAVGAERPDDPVGDVRHPR